MISVICSISTSPKQLVLHVLGFSFWAECHLEAVGVIESQAPPLTLTESDCILMRKPKIKYLKCSLPLPCHLWTFAITTRLTQLNTVGDLKYNPLQDPSSKLLNRYQSKILISHFQRPVCCLDGHILSYYWIRN